MIRAILLLTAVAQCSSFYFPGVDPISFKKSDPVEMKVNSMTSMHTQIPRDHYSLAFCEPSGGPTSASENLGEFITGNKIQTSPYYLRMQEEKFCSVLCRKTLQKEEAKEFYNVVKHEYNQVR